MSWLDGWRSRSSTCKTLSTRKTSLLGALLPLVVGAFILSVSALNSKRTRISWLSGRAIVSAQSERRTWRGSLDYPSMIIRQVLKEWESSKTLSLMLWGIQRFIKREEVMISLMGKHLRAIIAKLTSLITSIREMRTTKSCRNNLRILLIQTQESLLDSYLPLEMKILQEPKVWRQTSSALPTGETRSPSQRSIRRWKTWSSP